MSSPLRPPPSLLRTGHQSIERWKASAAALVELMESVSVGGSLQGADILDMGCGTKIAAHLINNDIAIHSYTGIDAESEVISYLQSEVDDPRFVFTRLDLHNEMYNPAGTPMSEMTALPGDIGQVDLITLFSVFTHVGPTDLDALLRLLRPHLRPHGRLVGTVFLNEGSTNPWGALGHLISELDQAAIDRLRIDHRPRPLLAMILNHASSGAADQIERTIEILYDSLGGSSESLEDQLCRVEELLPDAIIEVAISNIVCHTSDERIAPIREALLSSSRTPALRQIVAQATGPRAVDPHEADALFGRPRSSHVDLRPDEPMLISVFTREHFLDRVDANGYRVVEIHEPTPHAQHAVVLEVDR